MTRNTHDTDELVLTNKASYIFGRIVMRRISTSLLLAALLIALLVVTVYSQVVTPTRTDEVRILQGSVTHQVPVSITLIVPSESGAQTVTVPLMLNLNLSVGPLNALDMAVDVPPVTQFVSPLSTVDTVTPATPITSTGESTTTGN